MVTTFKFTSSQIHVFHYYFQYSMYEGIKQSFEIKKGDIKTNVKDTPPPEEKPVVVEEEFSVVERQIIFFWLEYDMQMITQQEYYLQITRLGYTLETVKTLIEEKSTALASFEKEV